MKILKFIILSFFGVAQIALAAPSRTKSQPVPSESIEVDDSNFKEIFESQTKVQQENDSRESGGETAFVGFSYLRPAELQLQNEYFSVDHSKIVDGLPSVQFGILKQISSSEMSSLNLRGDLGYGFYESPGTVVSKRGLQLKDNVSLQLLPLAAGVEYKRSLDEAHRYSLSITPLVGTWYVDQKGELDGVNQAAWLNHWMAKLAVGAFEGRKKAGLSFQGLKAGASYYEGFGSTNKLKGISYDLNVSIAL